MNTRGTDEHSVTVGLPGYELIGRDGDKHGPFATAQEAQRMAYQLWPLQLQDEERQEGWDIAVVGAE